MALQTDFVFNGIDIKNAYVRVTSFNGNKASLMYSYAVMAVLPATETLPERKSVVTSLTAVAPLKLDGGNPVKQAYEHLKTLPSMAGAVDC